MKIIVKKVDSYIETLTAEIPDGKDHEKVHFDVEFKLLTTSEQRSFQERLDASGKDENPEITDLDVMSELVLNIVCEVESEGGETLAFGPKVLSLLHDLPYYRDPILAECFKIIYNNSLLGMMNTKN